MMKWIAVVLVHSLLIPNLINVSGNNGLVHRRFEYKYSFKPPYLAQKDNTIPFFEYGGSKLRVAMKVFSIRRGLKLLEPTAYQELLS